MSARSTERTMQQERELTGTTFDRLLAELGSDPAAAGLRYERLRGRLVLFFLRRLLPSAEDLADQVIDRLARRLAEGEPIGSPEAYALGIAKFVLLEQNARPRHDSISSGNFPENEVSLRLTTDSKAAQQRQEQDRLLDAMERCLARLPADEVELLRKYYVVEDRLRIDARRSLVQALAVTPAALRTRIFLLCRRLRLCVQRQSASVAGAHERSAAIRPTQRSTS